MRWNHGLELRGALTDLIGVFSLPFAHIGWQAQFDMVLPVDMSHYTSGKEESHRSGLQCENRDRRQAHVGGRMLPRTGRAPVTISCSSTPRA